MSDMRRQMRDNLVAITSLAVALSALSYNTWRNERTERNRNVRVAGIELLQEIGSLQQIIFYAQYAEGDARGDPRMGWADVLTIEDLATMMPPDVGREAVELRAAWEADVDGLSTTRPRSTGSTAQSKSCARRPCGPCGPSASVRSWRSERRLQHHQREADDRRQRRHRPPEVPLLRQPVVGGAVEVSARRCRPGRSRACAAAMA